MEKVAGEVEIRSFEELWKIRRLELEVGTGESLRETVFQFVWVSGYSFPSSSGNDVYLSLGNIPPRDWRRGWFNFFSTLF